jgi:Protein of unknown function (DUF1153)
MTRWTPRKKADLIRQFLYGNRLTIRAVAVALHTEGITQAEFQGWVHQFKKDGTRGLRATRRISKIMPWTVRDGRMSDQVEDLHDSDCATHNMPASPNGECNCWVAYKTACEKIGANFRGKLTADEMQRIALEAIIATQ